MSGFCQKKQLISNFRVVLKDKCGNQSFKKSCPDKLLGENRKLVSFLGYLVRIFERILNEKKNAYIFFRKLTVTSPLGCRQVVWSIPLARLSFLETNYLLVSLLLLPATYNLSNEQSRFSQPGCSSYRAN